jgi:hypothetical protein
MEDLLKPLSGLLSEEFTKIQVEKVFEGLSDSDIEEIGGPEAIAKKKEELTEKMSGGMEKSMASSVKKLASKLTLLTTGAIDFATRLATVPLAIIGMGTTGPTISINLILPLIKQLQGEARNLSSVYDDVKSSMTALQMEELGEENAAIGSINSVINAELKIVKTMVLLVGVKIDGEEGTEPEVESPMPVDATVCTNYLPSQENQDKPRESTWCTRFEDIMGKTLDDFQTDSEGTKEEKYEAWRKENAKVLEDFEDSEEGTKEEQYLAWLREHRVCRNCKNFKK